MTVLDINQLIHESVTTTIESDNPSDSLDTSFMESVVKEVLASKDDVTVEVLQKAFPEVFENKDHLEVLKSELSKNNIFIEGLNGLNHELSTAIGLIASGVAVKQYSSVK